MIDPATVERIKNRADIVEVVGDYVHLIRRGSNFMGLCPFHNERTPSFSVNRQRNFCYCFSCKKGGSPVNFIMEKEGLTYHEALLHLARKYGIEVVERELTDEEREAMSEREAMFVANEWAMKKMEKDMLETDEGRDVGLQYLTQRGVTDEAIRAFHLGYAIDRGNELTNAALKSGFNLDIFKKLGLIGTSQQGNDYDRFRGRVIFPILNTAGKTIAFGGRDLKGGLAKYINSPESELYKKSNELYGIFQAKSAIMNEKKCFLVEGYMDVIGMWQSGMKNVVASSGTALTDGQIAMIHRFTDNITLIYDGDAAGIKASLRGIDMLLSHKLNVKVLLLPDGDDPDSFARKHTPEEFRNYVAGHETDIIRFKADVLLNEAKNDPQNRINAIRSVVQSIAHIPDPVSRDVYVQECSRILGMPDTTIAKSVAKAREELIAKYKRERMYKQFPVSGEAPQPAPSTQPQSSGSNTSQVQLQQPVQQSPSQSQPSSPQQITPVRRQAQPEFPPIYYLERNVLKYCVRYAFMECCTFTQTSEEDGTEQEYSLDVLEYITEELEDSNLTFSTEIFNRMFRILTDLRPTFRKFMSEHEGEIQQNISRLRQEGYDRISASSMSMDEIKREEKKLEEQIKGVRDSTVRELTKDYPGRILGSHEDDDVRKMTLELLFEKHHLSNIYLKEGNTELEEDRLYVLVIRAINEWKNEILNQRINELFGQLREQQENPQEVQRIQLELSALMNIRSQMSKCIGDRIVNAKR